MPEVDWYKSGIGYNRPHLTREHQDEKEMPSTNRFDAALEDSKKINGVKLDGMNVACTRSDGKESFSI